MIVYSNSCSFGEPDPSHPVYADIVADHLGAQLINHGVKSSCNRRIIRTTLRDLVELPKKPILVLLGLTFVSRTELWQPNNDAQGNDGHFYPIVVDHKKINWTKGLIDTLIPNISDYAEDHIKEYYKQWLLHYHPEAAVTELLTDLIMFTGWCQNNHIQYLIFSNVDVLPGDSQVGYTSPFLNTLKHRIDQDPNIIDLWNFSFGTFSLNGGFVPKDYHIYGKHGHPDSGAHRKFAEFLIQRLRKNDSN